MICRPGVHHQEWGLAPEEPSTTCDEGRGGAARRPDKQGTPVTGSDVGRQRRRARRGERQARYVQPDRPNENGLCGPVGRCPNKAMPATIPSFQVVASGSRPQRMNQSWCFVRGRGGNEERAGVARGRCRWPPGAAGVEGCVHVWRSRVLPWAAKPQLSGGRAAGERETAGGSSGSVVGRAG